MKYNGNSKETKKEILKDKMPYLYGELERLTKLDLLEIISIRDDNSNEKRLESLFYGRAFIQIYIDDVLMHELPFGDINGTVEYDFKDVFAIADKIEDIYIDMHNIKTNILFEKEYNIN